MSNPYFNATGNPQAQTRGLSSQIRSEFAAIEAGFDGIDGNFAGKAPINSPAFTGTPTAPTAAPGTNTTQLATTAFVDATFAKKDSPALTGTPTAPTPTAGDSSTKLATTEFVAGTAFAAALPAQSGNAGGVVVTDGTTASWGDVVTVVSGTTVNAAAGGTYDLQNAAATTVTLPTPVNGSRPITIFPTNGRKDNIVDSGAYNIVGPAGSVSGATTIDIALTLVLRPVNGAWRIM